MEEKVILSRGHFVEQHMYIISWKYSINAHKHLKYIGHIKETRYVLKLWVSIGVWL